MANGPNAPAQLYCPLNERVENSDKEREIQLYYELLSSGHSVGEILNGTGPVRGESEQEKIAAAEQPQSGRDDPRADRTAEAAPARASGSKAGIVAPADGYALGDTDPADFGNQERFWSRKLPGLVASIGFWALYTAAVASASIAGFSLLRAGRDANSTIEAVQPSVFRGNDAATRPGAAEDRAAEDRAAEDRPAVVAEGVRPRTPAIGASVVPPPLPSGAPNLAVPDPSQPIAATDREPVSANRRGMEATRSNAADPDAIEQLVERLTDPAEARPGSATATASVRPLSAAPADKAAPPEDAEKTSTAPPAGAKAAPPMGGHAANRRHVRASRHDAGSRRSHGRPNRATDPRPDYAARRGPLGPGQGLGAYDTDVARGYGQGAYGPAPYSDLGN